MNVQQARWSESTGWFPTFSPELSSQADLVLLFGSTNLIQNEQRQAEIRRFFPLALILGCSTAGEIFGTQVSDDSLTATAIRFSSSRVQGSGISVRDPEDSFGAGQKLARSLNPDGLVHVFILSDGLKVNGSELAKGLASVFGPGVTVTGGLSGDGGRFEDTRIFWDGKASRDTIAAVGFYGPRLKIGFGSLGGWDPFGPERIITRSRGNVLYELDGRSALSLYKMYLGEHANGLPATGLLFPLSIRTPEANSIVVRTILSTNEKEQSLTFAGDMPEGSYARLMKANADRLIDGAMESAKASLQTSGSGRSDLAILISCVGRKMVLKQRVEEEVEGVREILGQQPLLTGFYSYGEIAPSRPGAPCELHNQTMTITTLSES